MPTATKTAASQCQWRLSHWDLPYPGNSQHTLYPEPGQREIRNGSNGPRHKGPAACRALALHRRKWGLLNILDTCDPSFYKAVMPNGKLVVEARPCWNGDICKEYIFNQIFHNTPVWSLDEQVSFDQPASRMTSLFNFSFYSDIIKNTKACPASYIICCHFNCMFSPNQFTTPSGLNRHLEHYVMWKCKTGLTWWATLIVCIDCARLNLSLKQWLTKACEFTNRSVQTHHRGS